jgi:hypothetical protein
MMRDYMTRFGFLEPAPIELKESARPIRPREWSDSTLASLSFGYGISITPAQMSAAMGALTNGGRYIPLTLRKRRGAAGCEGRRVVSRPDLADHAGPDAPQRRRAARATGRGAGPAGRGQDRIGQQAGQRPI